MRGKLIASLDSYQSRTDTWCVTHNKCRIHIIAVYLKDTLVNPKFILESVRIGGCDCQPLEEIPATVWQLAEKLWPKG